LCTIPEYRSAMCIKIQLLDILSKNRQASFGSSLDRGRLHMDYEQVLKQPLIFRTTTNRRFCYV
jgi:hypothetical protein